MAAEHRHDPRDPAAEPCCAECCDCTDPTATLDAHLLECAACRSGDEPCAQGEHLMQLEVELELDATLGE